MNWTHRSVKIKAFKIEKTNEVSISPCGLRMREIYHGFFGVCMFSVYTIKNWNYI